MKRLLIHVEGETEETLVNEVLAPHLFNKGYSQVSARIVGNARQRDRRGGIRAWSSVRNDIVRHLREDSGCFATTFVDYYGLPQTGDRAWPGRETANQLSFAKKAITVESALQLDISQAMGDKFEKNRFIPFVMMYEFEALLFSDCKAFARGIGHLEMVDALQAIRDQFASPEEINDSPTTAPSKRVEQLVEGYNKPLLGTLAVLEIGLAVIRRECPHFHQWLNRLEVYQE